VNTVLVTGAAGQDGSYLCEQLLATGHQVHGLVRAEQQAGLGGLLAGVTLHDVDLTDEAGVAAVLERVRPQRVFNLAGVSSVAQSWREPLATARVNALAVAQLLEQCWLLQERTGQQVRVLQASSAEMFGATATPADEATPLAPGNPYGAAKAYAHQLVGVYRARGLHAVACVLYNHESPRRPEGFVTRKITRAAARIALGRERSLTLGNTAVRRDWGWAPDYTNGMARALDHDEAMDYVLATGVAHSLGQLVAAAFTAAGVEGWEALVHSDAALTRPTDSDVQVGNPARAARVLGWAPTVAFTDVVERMVAADLAMEGQ
jgi:GDPmannose 4,6-dehydratase